MSDDPTELREILTAIQCSDTGEEVEDLDPLVGHSAGRNAMPWCPTIEVQAAACEFKLGQGIDQLIPMVTPGNRQIGFPFSTPRPHQLEAIDNILNHFSSGHDVLFEAGTGFGKSPAEIGVVSFFESA